ncbi:MAG: universal stress protein [Peptostreptococcaceae bacterium]|nr:universal stress protein [Peptostreptococcaceae bacterium]
MKTEKIMVCVTEQKTCERLIQKGLELSKASSAEIFVLHIAVKNAKVIENPEAAEALEYLFEQSKEYGASVSILKSDNIKETLVDFAINNSITHIIMGQTRLSDEKDSVIFQLKKELSYTDVKISVIPAKEYKMIS